MTASPFHDRPVAARHCVCGGVAVIRDHQRPGEEAPAPTWRCVLCSRWEPVSADVTDLIALPGLEWGGVFAGPPMGDRLLPVGVVFPASFQADQAIATDTPAGVVAVAFDAVNRMLTGEGVMQDDPATAAEA